MINNYWERKLSLNRKPESPKFKGLTKEQYEEIFPLAIKTFKYVLLDNLKIQNPYININDLKVTDFHYMNYKGIAIHFKDMKMLYFFFKYDCKWYEIDITDPIPKEELVDDAELNRLMNLLIEEYKGGI